MLTTDHQSASLSWNKASISSLRQDFYCCQTVAGLLMWGALSDEKTGLSFTTAAGARQRSHSRFRDPWNPRLYFTVSDSRLPFSSPPTTRRVRVEVFDPAYTRVAVSYSKSKSGPSHITTDGQSVSLGVEPHLVLMTRYLLLFDSYGLAFVGRPLWREDGSVFCICCWPSPGSLSRVRVPWYSWPYFAVSDLSLPFSSPPTTRRFVSYSSQVKLC
jgi:hypothetical protein